jgi:3-hydroxybutyryl-CoA dehydrogenase
MEKIGVIGAGTMGRGVAQAFAAKNYQVVLNDCSQNALDMAKKEIYNITRFKNYKDKEQEKLTPEQVLGNIIFSTDLELLNDVDFVVENVTECFELKREIYAEIDKICKEEAIFAANTSCISVTKLANLTKRPEKVLGIHFMNPVAYIMAVEMIKGYHTSEETLKFAKDLLATIGKESIVIEDAPGFVSNRISHLMMNEAAFIVQEGIATPEAIDDIFKKCYGHTMGPCETADLIGLDTVVDSLKVLFDSYKDPKFRCCPLLEKMVDAGKKGRKTSEGFFKY